MTRVKMLALSTALALILPATARAADPADVVKTYADNRRKLRVRPILPHGAGGDGAMAQGGTCL